jgi:hypothetical protein
MLSSMSDLKSSAEKLEKIEQPMLPPSSDEPASQGPNLTLLYSILVVVLGAAITLAMLIVLPFWHRH